MNKATLIKRATMATLLPNPDARAAVDALFESLCAVLERKDRGRCISGAA